ncbi:MAG: M67 family metallopeptidase [Chloroflexi bacterium]|nr:M67 family metallopeptidase [Chloroflexota bacterium]
MRLMLSHLQAHYPEEACGILAGPPGQAVQLYPIDNIWRSPVAYEMAPQQQLAAMLEIEARGWQMTAVYHSHPTGPERPSAADVAQAYYPESVYIIVSLAEREQPVVRGFIIENGRFHEINLVIE